MKSFCLKKGSFFLLATFGLSFCSHDEYVMRRIDTDLHRDSALGREDIGTDRDKRLIIQEELSLKENLEEQQWRNESLETELRSLFTKLEDCHTYLIDPRLGGNSESFDLPKMDLASSRSKREEIGYDHSGKYKVVRKEYYLDRIRDEETKERQIGKMTETLKSTYKRCKARLLEARVRHGLPGEKYQAVTGKDHDGRLVILRRAERNLDDAFEFMREENSRP